MGAVARDDNADLDVWRRTRIDYLRARADFLRRWRGRSAPAYAVDPARVTDI
jgi:hypothetical protein